MSAMNGTDAAFDQVMNIARQSSPQERAVELGRVFVAGGMLTVERVCSAAGVSRATYYRIAADLDRKADHE